MRTDDDAKAAPSAPPLPPQRGAGGADSPEKQPGTEAFFRAGSAALAVPPGVFTIGQLEELLTRHYGLSGQVESLSSEVEHTARVTLADGRRLILKASMREEATESFHFQSAAISAAQGGAGFAAPNIIPTVAGAPIFQERGVAGYLQTCVAGSPVYRLEPAPDLLHRTGRALAELDRALHGCALPAMRRPLLWHIACWPRLTSLHHHIPQNGVADAVSRAMGHYVTAIEPRIGELDWQIIHNDPSPYNTLTDGDRIGFIDFGDGCWAPRIQDLAIAASHAVTDPSLPLGGAEQLIAGYGSVLPLSPLEAALLVGLMKARQSALILINYWRADLFPKDAPYIMKNVARAENGLAILSALDDQGGTAAVLRCTERV